MTAGSRLYCDASFWIGVGAAAALVNPLNRSFAIATRMLSDKGRGRFRFPLVGSLLVCLRVFDDLLDWLLLFTGIRLYVLYIIIYA